MTKFTKLVTFLVLFLFVLSLSACNDVEEPITPTVEEPIDVPEETAPENETVAEEPVARLLFDAVQFSTAATISMTASFVYYSCGRLR